MMSGRFQVSRRNPSHSLFAGMEPLESRALLSGDLVVTLVSEKIPTGVIIGKAAKGTVKVGLSNTDAAGYAKGTKITVQVLAVKSGGDSLVLGQAKNLAIAGLSSSKATKKLSLGITIPKNFEAGTYSLKVVADTTGALGETGTGLDNNTVSLAESVTVAAPFSKLTLTTVAYTFSSLTPGSFGTANVVVTNDGNVKTAGLLDVKFLSGLPGSTDSKAVNLGSKLNVKVSLAPGKSAIVLKKFRLLVPVNSSTSEQQYAVAAEISNIRLTAKTLTDTGTTADQRKAGPNLTLPGATRTTASPLLPGLGSHLSFTKTSKDPEHPLPGVSTESGTAVDELGREGIYTYVFLAATSSTPQVVSMQLKFPASGTLAPFFIAYSLTFTGPAIETLSGKSLTFGVADGIGTIKEQSSSSDPGVQFTVA